MKKLLILILLFHGFAFNSNAQKEKDSTKIKVKRDKIPVLTDRTFVSSSSVRSSFIETSLYADFGFGASSVVTIPGVTIGGYEILGFKGHLLLMNFNVQYKQRINKKLALFAGFNLAARFGGNMSAIMADGVNALVEGDIGWVIRLLKRDKINLSATIRVENINGNFINASRYFEDVINNHPDPKITQKVNALSVHTGIRGAVRISPTYGFQFDSEIGFGEYLVQNKSGIYFNGGVMFDANFRPKYNTPIGLALGYSINNRPEIIMNQYGITNLFFAKIAYIGSEEFELGLQFVYYNVDLKEVDKRPFIGKAILRLKFYF